MSSTDLEDVELGGNGPLVALLGCVVVVMIGFGVALTVLPVYTERIHGLAGADFGAERHQQRALQRGATLKSNSATASNAALPQKTRRNTGEYTRATQKADSQTCPIPPSTNSSIPVT